MKIFLFFLHLLITSIANSQNTQLSFVREGNDLYMKHEFLKAIELYKKDLVVNPQSPIVNYNLGLANYKMGNLIDAIKFFKKVIESSNEKLLMADAFYNLGIIYVKNNQITESLNAFKSAQILNPNNRLCKENLQLVLNNIKRKEKAKLESDSGTDKNESELKKQQNAKQVNRSGETKNNVSGEDLLKELRMQEKLVNRKIQKDKKRKNGGKEITIGW